MLGEASCVLLREEELAVGDHIELALAARLDLGVMLRL
jgi:hypothetical protein